MSRSADIDRIFAHIGAPDMKYHEFEPPPDTDQARANWSLVHSATRRDDETETQAPVTPAAPEQRGDAFRERVSERAIRAPHPSAGEAPENAAREAEPSRPLKQVFDRLGGRSPAPEPRSEPARETSATPLSQVFKRLS